MSAYREIVAEIQDLEGWQVELFAAGCAHRMAPLVDACGSTATAATYRQGLDAVWDRADTDERSRLATALEQAPEAAAESSEERAYYALLPITVLAAALRAPDGAGGAKLGELACSQALQAVADVDYTLLPEQDRPRIIDPRNPPPDGPLEVAETGEQRHSIGLLRQAGSAGAAVPDLRVRADRHAARLAGSMPEFVARSEWED